MKFLVLAWICIFIVGALVFLAFFRPTLPYVITRVATLDLHSEDFARQLSILAAAPVYDDCSVEVLTDGEIYYEAELEAIRGAAISVHLEAYIFDPGELTDRLLEAFVDRARDGVEVRLVLDAIGSMSVPPDYFDELKEAGGEVAFYHPTTWYTWDKINNRTHREIIVIDGTLGFLGGAGFADHWWKAQKELPAWKDSMFRIQGGIVDAIEAVFVENWAEAAGEILTAHPAADPPPLDGKRQPGIVFGSTPSAGGSTRARIVFQTLIASAQESIVITNPYFLPDASLRDQLIGAAERGVRIDVIVPGPSIDWGLTRSASRQHYGELLKGGLGIYEYEPTMMHRKTMVIDGLWSVVGSTNFDHRSFGLNDEVNLVVRSAELAERITKDFRKDQKNSKTISYEDWADRPLWERVQEIFSGLLERQQ